MFTTVTEVANCYFFAAISQDNLIIADDLLAKFLAHHPRSENINFLLASLHFYRNDNVKALNVLNEILQFNKGNSLAINISSAITFTNCFLRFSLTACVTPAIYLFAYVFCAEFMQFTQC